MPLPFTPCMRLGHEGRVDAVVSGDLLDDQPADHDAVGHDQGFVVVGVDLVLRGGDLVVRGLHGNVEAVERADRLLAQVVAQVGRQDVEVTAFVGQLGLAVALEVEVLELGAHEELESELAGAVELAAQHPARVALERLVVAPEHVAEHEGRLFVVLRPGQDLERVPVGHGHDVGLLDLGVAGDRGAVEGGARLDDAVELAVGDLDHLEVAEDVGEPQLDVLDLLVGDELADGGLALLIHGSRPFRPLKVDGPSFSRRPTEGQPSGRLPRRRLLATASGDRSWRPPRATASQQQASADTHRTDG